MTEQWRLFIALPVPHAVRQRVRAAQVAAREAGFAARWVAPESVHLTLKFLGDTDTARIAPLAGQLRAVVAPLVPFSLSTSRLGVFPNTTRPRILWLGLTGDLAPLNALHAAIDAALHPLGFPRETRLFRPHLTLGRVHERESAPPRDALATAQAALDPLAIPFPVAQVLLLRSELGRGGPRYTPVEAFPLGAAPDAR